MALLHGKGYWLSKYNIELQINIIVCFDKVIPSLVFM